MQHAIEQKGIRIEACTSSRWPSCQRWWSVLVSASQSSRFRKARLASAASRHWLIKDDRYACDAPSIRSFHEERILSSRCGLSAGTLFEHLLLGGVEQRAFVIGQLRRDDAEDILVFKRFGIAVILKIAMLGQAV